MIRPLTVCLVAVVGLASCAKRPPAVSMVTSSFSTVIPLPVRTSPSRGPGFTVTADTVIVVSPGDEQGMRIGRYLSDLIGIVAGPKPLRVEAAVAAVPTNAIHLRLAENAVPGEEAYELNVEPGLATITAGHPAGLFYGVQTFRQLLPPLVEYDAVRHEKGRVITAAAGRISDKPRFPWRGAMVDVSRHFLQVDEVKRYLDLMALYKLNRLHLHLADDQGWRIEIKSWPNLTTHGGSTEVGGGPGGFYTQDQYADIVRYAADRFITIVPEIDMPGHTNAALASYAELNCDGVARPLYTGIEVGFSALCVEKEVTYTFISDVVREIAAMTPGPWFHIGGDEVKTLSAEQYVKFVERVQGIVQSHGKQMVGWDEIAPAQLLPTSVVQHWRPKTTPKAAVSKGAKVIMSVANKAYLDMKYDAGTGIGLTWAALVNVRDAYDWDPAEMAEGVPESALLGVEAPLWSETIANIRDLEFLALPRLAGIAEVGWSPADTRDWDEFKERLGAHGPRLTALGVNFHRSPTVPWK
jgi:hexosaminidase